MVFDSFRSRKASTITIKDVSNLWHWNRRSSSLSVQPKNTFLTLKRPWIKEAGPSSGKEWLQPEYVVIAPKKPKEANLEKHQSRQARRTEPRIQIVEPAAHHARTTNPDQDISNEPQRLFTTTLSRNGDSENITEQRGRKHGMAQSQDCELDSPRTPQTHSRKSSRSHSASDRRHVKSYGGSNSRRMIEIMEPHNSSTDGKASSNNRKSREESSTRRRRERSTSHTRRTNSSNRRQEAQTPSPLPELDGTSVDTPVSRVSYVLETPIADHGARPRLSCQTTPHNRNESYTTSKDYSYKRYHYTEPIIYDESKHSPEDFYHPSFSPSRCSPHIAFPHVKSVEVDSGYSSRRSFLDTPDRLGLSSLSNNFDSSARSPIAGHAGKEAGRTLAPPLFSLSDNNGLATAKSGITNTTPVRGLVSQPSADKPSYTSIPTVQIYEPVFELPSDTPSSKKNQAVPLASKLSLESMITHGHSNPISSDLSRSIGTRTDQMSTSKSENHPSTTDSHDLANSTTPSDPRPCASYERLRPVPTHRRVHSETSTPSRHRRMQSETTTPDSHTRATSRSRSTYSYTPTRDTRADRKSFNTVRFLDSSGDSHEKLRRVLGI